MNIDIFRAAKCLRMKPFVTISRILYLKIHSRIDTGDGA